MCRNKFLLLMTAMACFGMASVYAQALSEKDLAKNKCRFEAKKANCPDVSGFICKQSELNDDVWRGRSGARNSLVYKFKSAELEDCDAPASTSTSRTRSSGEIQQ